MTSKLHEAYLDELVYSLDKIDESRKDVRTALKQIKQGKKWIDEFFPDLDVPYGKFVTYGKTQYGYELVPFEPVEARRILGDDYRPPFLI